MKRLLPAGMLIVLVLGADRGVAAATALAGDAPIPKHLQLGRTLVANLSSETTSYKHESLIRWKGDFLVAKYEARTDCSGLINSLLERAESPTIYGLKRSVRHGRPRSEDYYTFIAEQKGFTRIGSLSEVLPGDIIAIKYFERGYVTGHVMMVDAKPVLREQDTKPLIEGSRQWEVVVIDSTERAHGKGDTRIKPDGSKYSGVGRGTIRLYTNEQNKLVGFASSTAAASRLLLAPDNPIVIGRPISKTP